LEADVKQDNLLRHAKLANQLGSVCLQSQNYQKAITLFSKAQSEFENYKRSRDKTDEIDVCFTHCDFNLGNAYMAIK